MYMKLILISPRYVLFGFNLTQFGWQIWHRWSVQMFSPHEYRFVAAQCYLKSWYRFSTTCLSSNFSNNKTVQLYRVSKKSRDMNCIKKITHIRIRNVFYLRNMFVSNDWQTQKLRIIFINTNINRFTKLDLTLIKV